MWKIANDVSVLTLLARMRSDDTSISGLRVTLP